MELMEAHEMTHDVIRYSDEYIHEILKWYEENNQV
jgi:hypothetical protein